MTPAPNRKPRLDHFAIGSRRYLGSKNRLVGRLKELVSTEIGEISSLADPFAGTGVVASAFSSLDVPVLVGDLLYSNHLMHHAFLSTSKPDTPRLKKHIQVLNGLKEQSGYINKHFGDNYFANHTAGRMDHMRGTIQAWRSEAHIDSYEEAYLLTSLLYAADRVANTCGHYDAFRRAPPDHEDLTLLPLRVNSATNDGNHIKLQDANELIGQWTCDVLYLDPPYNTRQYSDTYHVLENIARWEKPEVYGVANKMDRSHLKSAYCMSKAAHSLDDLVQKADCRYILLSYNNMGTRGTLRSQARISDEDILTILNKRGPTNTFTFDFPAFSTGLAKHTKDHAERVFLCKVENKPTRGEQVRFRLEDTDFAH